MGIDGKGIDGQVGEGAWFYHPGIFAPHLLPVGFGSILAISLENSKQTHFRRWCVIQVVDTVINGGL